MRYQITSAGDRHSIWDTKTQKIVAGPYFNLAQAQTNCDMMNKYMA